MTLLTVRFYIPVSVLLDGDSTFFALRPRSRLSLVSGSARSLEEEQELSGLRMCFLYRNDLSAPSS